VCLSLYVYVCRCVSHNVCVSLSLCMSLSVRVSLSVCVSLSQCAWLIKRTSDFENFKEIEKPDDFIALSSASDRNDRYNKTPHSSYEFKIPTELVGRSSEYGFYLAIYEANSTKTITFPSQVEPTTFDMIPDTSNWAKLVSPDKSLPEFHWIIVVIISSFTLVIFLSRSRIINKY